MSSLTAARPRTNGRHLGLLLATALAILAASMAAVGAAGLGEFASTLDGPLAVYGILVYTFVGVAVLWRRPGHRIGRLALAIGIALATAVLLDLAVRGTPTFGPATASPFGLPKGLIENVRQLTSLLPTIGLFVGGILLITWFPDGRRTSHLGAVVEAVIAVATCCVVLGQFRDGILRATGFSSSLASTLDLLTLVALLGLITAYPLCVIDLGRRYGQATGVRRTQIRWVLAAAALSILLMLIALPLGDAAEVIFRVWVASTMLPVLAIAVAISRYHLYDIDRIISRTVSYAVVTAVLFAAFVAVNLVLQNVIVRLTGNESPFTVAVSTLVVAVLFAPVRTRVQAVVDRRFHRARYDAERTTVAFSERLRGEIDLPSLASDLDTTVRAVIAPSSVSLWLRGGGR